MAKPKTSNGRTWFRRHIKLTLLVLVIALLIGGIFIYQKVALELNKRAFQQARAAIDTVYADIVSKVGVPDDSRITRKCSALQEVYGDGPLSCFLDTAFVYPVTDKTEADQLRGKIQGVVSAHSDLLKPDQAPPSAPGVITSAESDSSPITDYFKAKGGIGCTIDYIFDPTFNTRLLLKGLNNKTSYIEISCFGPSKGVYY